MRILQANKFFYARGGAETVFFETIDGLRARGHHVAEFAMQHPKNLPSAYQAYFASEVPELLGTQTLSEQWRIFKRLFYSSEIAQKLTRLVQDEQLEIAHFHNMYHHLSATSFITMFKLNIPVVLTLHDVFPLCPNHSLLRGETLDESAFKGKTYNCLRYACINNSWGASLAGTLEAYYYRYRKIWEKISLFICPSQFMADKMVEWGYPREKMRVVLNPFRAPRPQVMPLGNKILFLGRLHFEKGIKIFLQAATELRDISCLIVGTGPEEAWVDNFIQQNKLTNVERWGWVAHGSERYFEAIRDAKVIVTPSIFYENCSQTILETLYYQRLAVATNRGGNPEMIIDGETGFLAQPEDPSDLARVLRHAMSLSNAAARSFTTAGYQQAVTNYAPDRYLSELEMVYHELKK
jgi:glycosyltransferase involved in cell wall biosynthesis